MAFRPDLKVRKSTPRYLSVIKISLMILAFFAVLIIGFILYFNGQHVKAPLIKMLEERTSLEVNCKQVEFSPIYPNILKIQELSLGHSLIGEVYLEYDIKTVISGRNFKINYLYIKDVKLDEKDLEVLKKERFGYENIDIAKLDLVNAPLYFERFTGRDTDLSAQNIQINPQNISFTEATLNAFEATFDDIKLKSLGMKLTKKENTFEVTDFNAKMLGGSVSAEFATDAVLDALNFRSIIFNNVIFQDFNRYLNTYTLTAENALLNNCVISIPSQDLLLGQLHGSIKDLSLSEGKLYYSFEGRAGEISKPSLGISADRSTIKAVSQQNGLDLDLKGQVLTGHYTLSLSLLFSKESIKSYLNNEDISLLSDSNTLTVIREATLKNAKIEPNKRLLERVRNIFADSSYLIRKLDIEDTEVVSFIDEVPFQCKTLSLDIADLLRIKQDKTDTFSLGNLTLGIKSAYFKDLYLGEINANISISEDDTRISFDKIAFYDSNLRVTLNVDSNNSINFTLKGEDFDVGELNSSFFEHTLSGKINIDTELAADLSELLQTKTKENSDPLKGFFDGINGYVRLNAKSLMVSGLGLDLLNGGDKRIHYFTCDEFFESLKHNDLGLYNLDFTGSIEPDNIKFTLKSDLSSSHITLKGNLNPKDDRFLATGSMSSLSKGNITLLKIEGPLAKPNFVIFPILRTETRPGLDENNPDSKTTSSSPITSSDDKKQNTPEEKTSTPEALENIDSHDSAADNSAINQKRAENKEINSEELDDKSRE